VNGSPVTETLEPALLHDGDGEDGIEALEARSPLETDAIDAGKEQVQARVSAAQGTAAGEVRVVPARRHVRADHGLQAVVQVMVPPRKNAVLHPLEADLQRQQDLALAAHGVDAEAAFELLHYWLFICSERKTKITRQDVIDRVNRVGKFAAERGEHYSQWFTTIAPIEDHVLTDEARRELTNEFYLGISTRYDHILADLDITRSTKLEKIAEAFKSTRVVIVHGASGQGKTTLNKRISGWRGPA
jgi:hypothetical protein